MGAYVPSSNGGAAACADSPANLSAKICELQLQLARQSATSAADDAKYRRLLSVCLQAAYTRPPMGSTQLCSVGLSILAQGGNPFAVGQAFAEHGETCSACGNDALAMVNHLEARP